MLVFTREIRNRSCKSVFRLAERIAVVLVSVNEEAAAIAVFHNGNDTNLALRPGEAHHLRIDGEEVSVILLGTKGGNSARFGVNGNVHVRREELPSFYC